MKKLDKLLITSFIPPFVMTFFIALFVLIMQFLWKYIDDIVGKGLEISVILELLFYLSTSLIPMALPIAVLISSVMVMGNLGERYELASIKSAGIPLLRMMMPLIFFTGLISVGSFLASDYLIPYSNLKFKSRLYDIRKQKPAFDLDTGVFNDDFGETIIRVNQKSTDGKELRDVMIYDHSENRGNISQMQAQRGEMYATEDKRFMVLKLYEGEQYQELKAQNREKTDNYEHLHIRFKEWEKIFDMSEFDLDQTNTELFKNHHSMLNVRQLNYAIDSLQIRKTKRNGQLIKNTEPYFYISRRPDSVQLVMDERRLKDTMPRLEVDTFINIFPEGDRGRHFNRAITLARNVKNYAQTTINDLPKIQESIARHEIEWHRKFSMAYACLMFLFIGAPMGAIIRKGGFGWPLLVSIFFFVAFIMMMIMGEKSAKILAIPAWLGMWLPCLVLTPIGLILTRQAMRDSKVLNIDTYLEPIRRLLRGKG